jgi:glycosyltransferase involved in cell wall biosynthesis
MRQPERVVILNDISAWRGGATGVALSCARGLAERGIPVSFITGDDASESPLADTAVEMIPIASAHILDGPRAAAMMRGLYNLEAARFVKDWIAQNDTPGTVYHLHGWSKILSPSIFSALTPVLSRLVVHAPDFFLICPNGGYFDFRRDELCTRRPMGASCITCNCDRRSYTHKLWRLARSGVRQILLTPKKIGRLLVVHHGMIPLFAHGGIAGGHVGVLRNPVAPWSGTRIPAERNRTFLFVGRLDEDKGVDLLASAARQAGVPLRMVGAGPLGETLASAFPEVEFSGWRSRGELAELCLDARAIVMPTRSRETFGIAGLEALMSGAPLIISSNALLAPEIEAGGFVLVCDPHDRDALAGILKHLASDDERVAGMSKSAYERARTLAPTFSEWIDAIMAEYASLAEVQEMDMAAEPAAGTLMG